MKWIVSITQEACVDFEVEAETEAEAKEKALSGDTINMMLADDWCEGHQDTRRVTATMSLD